MVIYGFLMPSYPRKKTDEYYYFSVLDLTNWIKQLAYTAPGHNKVRHNKARHNSSRSVSDTPWNLFSFHPKIDRTLRCLQLTFRWMKMIPEKVEEVELLIESRSFSFIHEMSQCALYACSLYRKQHYPFDSII